MKQEIGDHRTLVIVDNLPKDTWIENSLKLRSLMEDKVQWKKNNNNSNNNNKTPPQPHQKHRRHHHNTKTTTTTAPKQQHHQKKKTSNNNNNITTTTTTTNNNNNKSTKNNKSNNNNNNNINNSSNNSNNTKESKRAFVFFQMRKPKFLPRFDKKWLCSDITLQGFDKKWLYPDITLQRVDKKWLCPDITLQSVQETAHTIENLSQQINQLPPDIDLDLDILLDRMRRHFHRIQSLAKKSLKAGAVVVVGVLVYKGWNSTGSNVLHASWTTNYEPSVKWNSNWDRREPKSLVRPVKGASDADVLEHQNKVDSQTPKTSRHLILIRHGQYFDNANVDKERFLTSLGRSQAELTGERLKELNLPYTSLVSSTMTRALETAKIIRKSLPHLEHNVDDSLREGAPIPPEPPLGSWRPEQKQFFQDGARIESAFRKYFYRAAPEQTEDSYEIIVCHANVIRYFVCRALQFPPEGWLRLSLAHGSITHVTIRPSGRVSVRALGDHGFMPVGQISYS
ncbi:serine/threonine-protein phosphatase Pgam5, mitochondrial [Elysia marginata]|uniref:Serine/threonine-protein phosphatase PGAM5, mitochondrial n=1 Tax=Elysia marginata TaxID=1093978 RepID=A0AAV4HBQ0_9GAST|nr:serine/threonine-protein phosphatase Pgam5, mitochondrial [Elysia marginata]